LIPESAAHHRRNNSNNDIKVSALGTMDVSVTACVWSAILLVPLTLTSKDTYKSVFPSEWYDSSPRDSWNNSVYPSPLGLSLGILAVIVGQISVLIYFWALQSGAVGKSLAIQKAGPPPYNFREGLMIHLSQPEGFVMLGSYLIGTWMFGLMPSSYYSFSGGINWSHVLLQLVAQDCIQCVMHFAEHKLDARIYKASHKPHHKFTNPKLFDAFNGSATGADHSTSA
jgi:alternative squalene epoxidase